jgi:hypothetical protein
MTALDLPSPTIAKLQIDKDFLVRQVSQLTRVKRQRCSWDEFGEKVARDFSHPRNVSGKAHEESTEWRLAKELVHDVLVSCNPQHDGIRKRLGVRGTTSTPLLLSTLSLWLAGVLKISVSVTVPMVAGILYAIGDAGGDPEILR